MTEQPSHTHNNRIGFHYFPDTLHYRDTDLSAWLPELKALGASWLTLNTPADRAIPEAFIKGLIDAGIEPILHFHLSLKTPPKLTDLTVLFDVYASWGVKYVVLFNRPNCHEEWANNNWARQNLVLRFLDFFVPLAEAICRAGMTPVFPPLEPGGDFWDTAFLRSALQGMLDQSHQGLLDKLALGAYAWAHALPLNWGAGGPERWAGALPYSTPEGEENQMGFRVFDWYTTISKAVLGEKLPILLLATGSHPNQTKNPKSPMMTEGEHALRNLQIAGLLAGEEIKDGETKLKPIPEHVLVGNFWLLAANPKSPEADAAWYHPEGSTSTGVEYLKEWTNSKPKQQADNTKGLHEETVQNTRHSGKPVKHYLLLPTYEWGVANWHLEVIRPFIQKHMPTIGFSVEEATTADKVTIVGGEQAFPSIEIQKLRAAGCNVEQISGDGTSIATQLETL